ncbi:MAG: hypothetical protein JO291_07175 [Acidimicrobiia bacterium]|nr:hypothetical protein [Acidimicrobiia bacterium]
MNPVRKMIVGGALAVAAVTGGAIGASFVGSAGAATATSTSPSAESSTSANLPAQSQQPQGTPDWSKGGHQANGKTETLLTGTTATKAKAAAEAAVPGATAQRAETDAEGAAYEVHMTKSDGSVVTVKLDSNFKVTDTIDGMG